MSTDFESRKRNLQQELSDMINAETDRQGEKQQNSNQTPDYQQQEKTFFKLKAVCGNPSNPLDTDYQRFVDDLLVEQYAARCADFRNVEEIIVFLDHKSVEAETSTSRHIAPFNSNLPVLNISKCEDRQPSVSNSCLHPKGAQSKLYSSLLKPLLTDTSTTPLDGCHNQSKKTNSTARRVPKKSEEGRALMASDKSSSRKQLKKERGRRSNRPKQSQSGDSVLHRKESNEGLSQFAHNTRGPPLLETPTDIHPGGPILKAQPKTTQCEDLRQLNDRIEREMHDLLLQEDETTQTVVSTSQTTTTPEFPNTPIGNPPLPVSSQEIFLMNLKTLQKQTSTTEEQQRLADEHQRLMTTLFLRQNFSHTNSKFDSIKSLLYCIQNNTSFVLNSNSTPNKVAFPCTHIFTIAIKETTDYEFQSDWISFIKLHRRSGFGFSLTIAMCRIVFIDR